MRFGDPERGSGNFGGSGNLPDLGQSELDSPHLSLIFQAIFADDLEPMK
jgi:hypothetical protein